MKLIKKLGTKLHKNDYLQSWGIFLCPYCFKEIKLLLTNGKRYKSCGCVKYDENKTNTKHGYSDTKLYVVWYGIKTRCLSINSQAHKHYGSRGITICPEWTDKLNGFINFRIWSLSNGYKEGLFIDRIKVDGNYKPSNCRWVTIEESNRNTRKVKLNMAKANEIRDLHKTGNYTQKELAYKFSVTIATISYIINNKRW